VKIKRRPGQIASDLAFVVVGDTGFEPVTSSVSTNGPHRTDLHEHDGPQVRARRYEQLSPVQSLSTRLGAAARSQPAPTAALQKERLPGSSGLALPRHQIRLGRRAPSVTTESEPEPFGDDRPGQAVSSGG